MGSFYQTHSARNIITNANQRSGYRARVVQHEVQMARPKMPMVVAISLVYRRPCNERDRKKSLKAFLEAINQNELVKNDNRNLSIGQKELLGCHFKLGHFNLHWIQRQTLRGDGA